MVSESRKWFWSRWSETIHPCHKCQWQGRHGTGFVWLQHSPHWRIISLEVRDPRVSESFSSLKTRSGCRFGDLFDRNVEDRVDWNFDAAVTYFFEILVPSFFQCVFYNLRHGHWRERRNTEGSKLDFWVPLVHFEIEGERNFDSGYVSYKSRFYQVLSLSVRASASVESGECHLVEDIVIKFTAETFWSTGTRNLRIFSLVSSLFYFAR